MTLEMTVHVWWEGDQPAQRARAAPYRSDSMNTVGDARATGLSSRSELDKGFDVYHDGDLVGDLREHE